MQRGIIFISSLVTFRPISLGNFVKGFRALRASFLRDRRGPFGEENSRNHEENI